MLLQHNAPWAWLSNAGGRSLQRALDKHRRETLMCHTTLTRYVPDITLAASLCLCSLLDGYHGDVMIRRFEFKLL